MRSAGSRLSLRVGKSAGWVVVGRILARASGFVTITVLARLLTPEAFGIVGFALLANGLVDAFSQIGVKEYLIQRAQRVRPLLGAAWTLIILRSLLITVLLIAAAPAFAAAFGMPEATDVLRVMALIPLLRGLVNIEAVYFVKHLEFHKQIVLDSARQIGLLVVGVGLALLWRNVWALALGHVAGALLECALSYLLCRTVPRPRLSLRRARLMFRFGTFVLLGSVTGYFAFRGGEWLVARLFETHALGLYVLAFTITNLPAQDLAKPLGRVLFPTFALLRDQPERLRAAFVRSWGVVVALTAPLCLGLVLVADDFAALVLGPQWHAIAPLLVIAGLAALGRTLSTSGSGLFYALGRPELSLLVGLVGVTTLVLAVGGYVALVPAAERSLLAVAAAAATAQITEYATRVGISLRLLGLVPGRLLAANRDTALALALMVLGVLAVRAGLDAGALRLAAMVTVGGLLYAGSLLAAWILLGRGPLAALASLLGRTPDFAR